MSMRLFALLLMICLVHVTNAATKVGFYAQTCPTAESIVKSTVKTHMNTDVTVGAGILRLHFHDCFVHGCDGSVLIDGSSAEKTAPANIGLRGFDVIDDAKTQIEAACPGVVSCADILALAARDAVSQSGGPTWPVPTGRRDGRVSSAADSANMPSPLDSVTVLKQKFSDKGLNTADLVTLNGAHTIGQTDCRFFSYRLYNFTSTGNADPTISKSALAKLQQKCPSTGSGLDKVELDAGSRDSFDNSYYKNVRQGAGVLESDQRFNDDSSTRVFVASFGLVGATFKVSFVNSMIKMSNVEVNTGSVGEIRKVCSAIN